MKKLEWPKIKRWIWIELGCLGLKWYYFKQKFTFYYWDKKLGVPHRTPTHEDIYGKKKIRKEVSKKNYKSTNLSEVIPNECAGKTILIKSDDTGETVYRCQKFFKEYPIE